MVAEIPNNRKRCCADEAAQDNRSPKRLCGDEADQGDSTAKRKRPHNDMPPLVAKKIRSTGDYNLAPLFFDNLSKVLVTQGDLRELDLARLARHGGLDIGYLRGVCSHYTPLR